MKNKYFFLVSLLIFILLNLLIAQKEYQVRNSDVVLFKLAPRDPRSIMQGDYMVLNYELQNQFRKDMVKMGSSGTAILSVDSNGVASLSGKYQGEPLKKDQKLLRYRSRNRSWRGNREYLFATHSYLFQEGKAKVFERAQYGAFALTSSGKTILLYLTDSSLKKLE